MPCLKAECQRIIKNAKNQVIAGDFTIFTENEFCRIIYKKTIDKIITLSIILFILKV